MLGRILNNRYQIISKLGGGGFGETYLAIDQWQEEDNRCVVKQLKPNIVNKFTLRLFEQEAQVLFKLGNHDQIPQLLAHFQQDEEFYLVQEFIDGHDLTSEIKLGECWDETEVIKLLQDILEVLTSVHNNNVIHRDLKPANIMRRIDGKIVLIDFGGVKQLTTVNSSTVSTHIVGTPGYMPQEQINNQAQLCSDIYAVGMLAISALTGWKPNELPTDLKTFQLLWRDRAQVSNTLADVLERMVKFHFIERYQSATEALNAINTLSFTALDWYNRGQKLHKSQRYDEAIAAFSYAIEIQPNYHQALTARGYALNQLGKHDEALASCNQAIRFQSDDFDAWCNRALALNKLGRYSDAITSFDRAIQIKPDCHQAWYERGEALNRLGKYEEALASFERAIQIKPDCHQALYGRGAALNKLGRYEEALASFDHAIQFQSDDSDVWHNRGVALNELGRYDEALASFERAIQIKPEYCEAWNHQGETLHSLRRYEEALASFDKAIQIHPEYSEAWNQRGMTLNTLIRYKEAIACYDEALTIQPDFKSAIKNRKAVQRKLRESKLLIVLTLLFFVVSVALAIFVMPFLWKIIEEFVLILIQIGFAVIFVKFIEKRTSN